MRIAGVYVYGYGKLENLELNQLSPNVQVLFGENETGKSTLMSFIHSILFGFPTKQQIEERYEPKSGQKYGGKLILETEAFGRVVIERLPGKAVGDVTVFLPNGVTGGEEELNKILKGMDKNLYQNIYSFNIHGIQGVSKLDSKDLGRFLLSSGAIGTDALLSIDQRISKELEGLFKPSGKKPILNLLLHDLKDSQSKLSLAKEKNNTYHSLTELKTELTRELAKNKDKKKELEEHILATEKVISIKPILEEKRSLEMLEKTIDSPETFPIDGIERLNNLLSKLHPYEAQVSAWIDKQKEWDQLLSQLHVNSELLEDEAIIQNLIGDKRYYEENQHKHHHVTHSIVQLIDEVEYERSLINLHIDENDILSLDTSMSTKETIKNLANEKERLQHKKQLLDDSFQVAKEELEVSEAKIKQLVTMILPVEKREIIEKKLTNSKEIEQIENDKNSIQKAIHSIGLKIDRAKENQKKQAKKFKTFFTITGIMFLIFAGLLVLSNQMFLAGLLLLAILLFPFLSKSMTNETTHHIVEELNVEKQELQQSLTELMDRSSSISIKDVQSLQEKIMKDQQARQLVEIEKATFNQLERKYVTSANNFDNWEKEDYEVTHQIKGYKKQYKLPGSLSNQRIFDAFLVIERLKEKIRQKQKLESQLQNINQDLHAFQLKIGALAEKYQVNPNAYTTIQTLEHLYKKLETEKKKQDSVHYYQQKIEDSTEQLSYLQLEVEHIHSACKELWSQAEVDNEEDFRIKGKLFEEVEKIQQRLRLLNSQLVSNRDRELEWNPDENYESIVLKYKAMVEDVNIIEGNLQQQLSEVNIRIQELEEGGTYADLFHSFELKKANFQENAKHWAVYAIAKDILTKTIEQYRTIRLPELLIQAEEYLKILTEEKYVKIYSSSKNEFDGFTVERWDGVRFTPNELSQATAEQLYVSIRFALAKTMNRETSFPLIIDDSFVNFDENRSEKAILLLQEISKEHQVLFFTCHQHILSYFSNEEVIELKNYVGN